MGQFLFVEDRTKFPLLDAFAEFLVQAKVDFNWNISGVTTKYDELQSEALEMSEKALEKHSIDKFEDESSKNVEKVK